LFPSVLLATLIFGGCGQEKELAVERMAMPEYPVEARSANIQGRVIVSILIGPDGKVLFAKARSGHPVLQKAAEENVRQWVFGPFPPVGEFPIEHAVTYEFKIDGKPAYVVYAPLILTFLPDRVEIIGRPVESDYPESVPDRDTSETKE